ncbi:MAG: FAD-binding oxidoreductase [Sedimentibacter sp.]|uniref:FAD-binding oxidoreductase n=1 Tax=Sedimentibacter sp. TaxID=1960295 RepID=UPI002981584D|nr:FAD-binding oxidoreductase [Sedimentibacter sp.]MDW5299774.1 FAD-binding oxidoreductase [Sedimentibacter sp.]
MENNLFIEMYGEYLRDESRQTGTAKSITFPKIESEIIESVKENAEKNIQITTQGARTGLAASAVPFDGHIINLSKMNNVVGARYDEENDRLFLKVQPGVLLAEVRKYLLNKSFITTDWDEESKEALNHIEKNQWFYSTDPTEISASIGGMAACNASGAKSFRYGSTRDHIESLRIILSDGDVLKLKRGQTFAKDGKFELVTESGRVIVGELPKYNMPNVKKNTSGYFNRPSMDMIDLFIGSDGTLGIISELEIELNKTQDACWGVTIFMPDEDKALDLVRALRGEKIFDDVVPMRLKPSAIEFFSHNALNMLRNQQRTNPAFSSIQEIKDNYHTAVYIEIEEDSNDEIWAGVEELGTIIEKLGGDEDATWVANNSVSLEKLHSFRHACPECVNMQIDIVKKIDERITKLGTDMSVPDDKLKQVMRMYNDDIEKNGLHAVIFGHIGNNHLHVNIIPRNMEEYEIGKRLYLTWAEKIAAMGGAVSAEHGVGKLKVPFLEKMYSKEELNEMRKLKKIFDPMQLFNRGAVFSYDTEEGK